MGVIIFLYNFFLRNNLGVEILVYVGWPVWLVGSTLHFMAIYELRKGGKKPKRKGGLLTTVLVVSGVYAVVRHPMFLGSILAIFGSALISQHWLTLILGVLALSWFFSYILPMADEELIKKFGDDYKRYMQKVPKMNFAVGAIRLLKNRKEKERRTLSVREQGDKDLATATFQKKGNLYP